MKNTLTNRDAEFLRECGIAAPGAAVGCDCGSGLEPRIVSRCSECASADDVNAFLFMRGLRSCPHSDCSSDEDFARCPEATETLRKARLRQILYELLRVVARANEQE